MEEYLPEKRMWSYTSQLFLMGTETSWSRILSSLVLPLPTLDLPESENFSENREESQLAGPLCTGGTTLENAPNAVHHKSTRENFEKPAKKYSDQLYL